MEPLIKKISLACAVGAAALIVAALLGAGPVMASAAALVVMASAYGLLSRKKP